MTGGACYVHEGRGVGRPQRVGAAGVADAQEEQGELKATLTVTNKRLDDTIREPRRESSYKLVD